MSDFRETDIPDLRGRTALVTGANSGLGYHTARLLAARGARVLLGCRDSDKTRDALRQLEAAQPDAGFELVPLDLGNLASVERAAARVLREPQLDLLINNAGIMMPPRQLTIDGFESQFVVNHLGHFALTGRLLPLLRRTPGARVVTVSSNAHRWGDIDFDDLHAKQSYSRRERYGMSKLANLLFTYELQRRLEKNDADCIALASHPGVSPTDLGRHMPRAVMVLLKPVFWLATHSPDRAALPSVRAATDPTLEGGAYIGPGGFQQMKGPPVPVRSNRASHDRERARRLWDASIELTGVDPGL